MVNTHESASGGQNGDDMVSTHESASCGHEDNTKKMSGQGKNENVCLSCIINPRHVCAEGLHYLLCVSVCVCVCLSVTTLVAALFISTIKLQYEQLQFSILFIFNLWISKNCFVHKLWRHLLTMTDSGSIAAIPVSFFPTAEGSEVVQRQR